MGVNGPVSALAFNGNQLYVGGFFTEAGGKPATNIAVWNGTNWSGLGSGVGRYFQSVFALAASGSEVFVGGDFDIAGGKPSQHFAIWHVPHYVGLRRSGDMLTLSWPATGSNFVLETRRDLGESTWTQMPELPVAAADDLTVLTPFSSSSRFYRLRRP